MFNEMVYPMELVVLKNVLVILFTVAMVYGMNRMYCIFEQMKDGL